MNKESQERDILSSVRLAVRPIHVFIITWLVLFCLYLPASKAGWTSDPVEIYDKIKHWSFLRFLTLRESRGNEYQLTQLMTYLFYRLWGTNPWAWDVLFVTLQSVNATLLFIIFTSLFEKTFVRYGRVVVLGGILLFCVCPHLSEVMVWKASYHYLQAMLLMLCVIRLVQKFFAQPKPLYVWTAGILFALSTLSDEFFFLTPFFVFTLILYYRESSLIDSATFKKALLYFLLPVIVLIAIHILLPKIGSASYASNLGDEAHQSIMDYLRKPPLYIFHTVFMGRFFGHDFRQKVYDFTASVKGIAIIYGIVAFLAIYVVINFRKLNPAGKTLVLLFVWMALAMLMVCPVWFPEIQLISFDRYTYFMLPFVYMLLMVLLTGIKMKEWAVTFFIVYVGINGMLTIKVSKVWGASARVVNKIIHDVPPINKDKVLLLLNEPANMDGAPMIGPFLHFSFQKMYNLYNERQINNTTYDVVSYNMTGPGDGAHVNVYNDSMMHVTLNQWGTWWWYGMWGAFSYQNEYYRVNMMDQGHWYELTLKHPASDYVLLYNVGDEWHVVDWNKKNDDQN